MGDNTDHKNPPSKPGEYNVAAVEAAMNLLALVGDMPGRGLSDLARLSGITKPRVFRLLQTMEAAGFITRSGAEARYWLGFRSKQLGDQARDQIDLAAAAAPIAERIGKAIGETVQVRVRKGLESYCVHAWVPPRVIRHHAEKGQPVPLYVGSSKTLLAFAPLRLRETVLSGPLSKLTERTLSDRKDLEAALDRIRKDGYCVSVGESDPDAISAGVPVRDPSGTVVAVFIVAAPVSRRPPDTIEGMIELAKEGAHALEGALSFFEQRPD